MVIILFNFVLLSPSSTPATLSHLYWGQKASPWPYGSELLCEREEI